METIDFVTLDKITGTGNGTVTLTVPARVDRGRNSRSVVLRVTAGEEGNQVTKDVTVQQSGDAIQIYSFGPGGTRPGDSAIEAESTAGEVADSGEANCQNIFVWVKKVTSLYSDDVNDGTPVESGVRVVDRDTSTQFSLSYDGDGLYTASTDLGKDKSYHFAVELDLPANNTTAPIYYRISVCANSNPESGDTVFHSFIKQKAGAAKLTVSPDFLDFSYSGENKQISINSNANWTIAEADDEGTKVPLIKLATPEYAVTIISKTGTNLTCSADKVPQGVTKEDIEIDLLPDVGNYYIAIPALITLSKLTPSTRYTIKIRFKGDNVNTSDSDWQTLTVTTNAESSSGGDTGDISVYGMQDSTNNSTFTKGDTISMSASKLNSAGSGQAVLLVELITKSRTLNIASSYFSVLDAGGMPYASANSSELFASAIESGQDLTTVSDTSTAQLTGSFDSTTAALTIPNTLSPDSEGRFIVFVAFSSSHTWSSGTHNASITFETGDAEATANITVN